MTAMTKRRPSRTIGNGTLVNLSTAELYEHAARRGEGIISAHGSLVVRTDAGEQVKIYAGDLVEAGPDE